MKPPTTRRLDYWVFSLTILATLPFENGPLAMIIPPHWKPYVASAGLIANMILAEIKLRQTASKAP